MNGGCATDEVIVTPRTFLASVSTANAGAVPVFADVDRNSGNMNANSVAKVVTQNTCGYSCTFSRWPCDRPNHAITEKYGLKVIEDCAQAHGAMYKGRPVGSIGHWSLVFLPGQIMTTGGRAEWSRPMTLICGQ